MLRVVLRSFAQIRELVGRDAVEVELPVRSTIADAWGELLVRAPKLGGLTTSTRVARNGVLAAFDDELAEGDEVAFLPPFGGG